MADIEQGLKEAVAAAQAKGRSGSVVTPEGEFIPVGDSRLDGDIVRGFGRQPGKYGRPLPDLHGDEHRPPLTAMEVIETIMTLTKQAHSIDALSYELSDDLAGAANNEPQVNLASGGNEAAMSIFDRMGLGLLELTRSLESIDRNVRRSLGAVRP